MVEQRKSLPQAVPSSICSGRLCVSHRTGTLQSLKTDFFSGWTRRRHGGPSSGREQREKQTKISRSLPCRCKEISGQTYVGASVVVDGSLGHHGVVLELRLAERRSVGRDEDELGLAGAEGLEGAAVAEDDLAGLDDKGELFERALWSAFWCFRILQISHNGNDIENVPWHQCSGRRTWTSWGPLRIICR